MRIIWIRNLKDSLEIIRSTPEREVRMSMIKMHVWNVSQVQNVKAPKLLGISIGGSDIVRIA